MVGQEEDMHLEDMAGADLMAPGGEGRTDPAEVAMGQAEAATDLAMGGEEYQWARWQPEQALA